MVALLVIVYLAIIVLLIVGIWKVFEKAGKKGYESLIFGHNIVVMLNIVGKPMWWFFLFLIPYVGILIFGIWLLNLMSISFGKGVGFTIGLIFLPFIFWPILGLGSAEYQGPSAKEAQQEA